MQVIAEGIFTGLTRLQELHVRLDVADLRANGWPEVEVIQLRTAAIAARRAENLAGVR